MAASPLQAVGGEKACKLLDRVRLGRVGTDMQDLRRMPFGEASSRSSRKTPFCVRVAGCPLVDAHRNVIISRYVFTTTALRALSQVAAENQASLARVEKGSRRRQAYRSPAQL